MFRSFIILSLICIHIHYGYASNKYEIRAAWITTIGGLDWPHIKASSEDNIKRQKDELCKQLDILKENNFNTVLFQTRLRGDVIYPSIYETFTESLTGQTGKSPGYDPLKFAIEECHKRGMELHAWIVCIPIGNNRQVKLLGKQSIVKKQADICLHFKNVWYLDPGNPRAVKYLTSIVKEITMCYDIDGIHLDYIRYPENGNDFPDSKSFKKYGKGQTLTEWRRNNITEIVRNIYHNIKSLKPWVKISCSPVGKYKDTQRYSSMGWNAYNSVYQDAKAWINEGIIDALFPMMYFKNEHFYPFVLDWQENKSNRWIIPGLGVYFLKQKEREWSVDDIMKQMLFIRRNSLDGQAFFRNEFIIKNTRGITDLIKHHYYKTPAFVPPMKWQDSIQPKAPQNGKIIKYKDSICFEWNHNNIKKGGIYYRIYASNLYPVDIEKPENIICSRIDECKFTYRSIKHRKNYWAITAVDRYGNESIPYELNIPDNKETMITINTIPDIPNNCRVFIEDFTGKQIDIPKGQELNFIKKIKNGIYIIKIIRTDGKENTVIYTATNQEK